MARWYVTRTAINGRIDVIAQTVRLPAIEFDDGCVARFGSGCHIWDEQQFADGVLGAGIGRGEVLSQDEMESTGAGLDALQRWFTGNDEDFIDDEFQDMAAGCLETIVQDYRESDPDGVMRVLNDDHSDPLETIRAAHALSMRHLDTSG